MDNLRSLEATKMSRSVMFLCLLMVFAPLELTAQTTNKLRVSVSAFGEDPVEQRLAYLIEEGIRRSAAYSLSTVFMDSDIDIRLESADLAWACEDKYKKDSLVVTVIFTQKNYAPFDPKNPQTWKRIYLDSFVYVVRHGADKLDAQFILSMLKLRLEILQLEIERISKGV
jgi:hypothetical protein